VGEQSATQGAAPASGVLGALGELIAGPGRVVNGIFGYLPGGGLITGLTGGLFKLLPGGSIISQLTGLGGDTPS